MPPKPGRKSVVKFGQSTRKLTRLQMYQKQYYAPKWSILCERKWQEYQSGPEDEGNKKARITYINELCVGFLEGESGEVKKEIDILMERQARGEQFLYEDVGSAKSGTGGGGEEVKSGGESSQVGEAKSGGGGESSVIEKLKAAEGTLTVWDQ